MALRNALAVANPGKAREGLLVNYPGLESSPAGARSAISEEGRHHQLRHQGGPKDRRFIDNRIPPREYRRAKTLAIHPATTTTSGSEEEQVATGITWISSGFDGIEHIDDIIADIGQGAG